MVLEALFTPAKAEDKRYKMIFLGLILCFVSSLLSYLVFEQYASLLIVSLTALAATPLMYNIIKYEEEKDLEDLNEGILLKEHSKALSAFMYLFLGITIACIVMYIFLPWDITSSLFKVQTETLQTIRGGVTGMSTLAQLELFLVFAILFSFILGAGAIFVLAWNASVIGTAIGNFIRGNLSAASELIGFDKVAKYFNVITFGLLRYSLHGIPEILAYFTAGLAGGIISVAIIKHDLGSAKFEHIILDSADLLLISIGLIFFAGIIEVWITPLVFPLT
jgi:hypothetical protein